MSSHSSGNALNRCGLCMQLYKKAQNLIDNNIFRNIAEISAGILCGLAEISVGGGPGVSLGVICQQVAKNVINYIKKNGFSRSPRDACIDMGLCPSQNMSPWGWKAP